MYGSGVAVKKSDASLILVSLWERSSFSPEAFRIFSLLFLIYSAVSRFINSFLALDFSIQFFRFSLIQGYLFHYFLKYFSFLYFSFLLDSFSNVGMSAFIFAWLFIYSLTSLSFFNLSSGRFLWLFYNLFHDYIYSATYYISHFKYYLF